MAPGRSTKLSKNSSANVGFEAKLWNVADKLRSNMVAAEYKHVVLYAIGTIGMGASRSEDILTGVATTSLIRRPCMSGL